MSPSTSTPATRADNASPPAIRTVGSARRRTWALVRTRPGANTTTEPPRHPPPTATSDGEAASRAWRTRSPTPLTMSIVSNEEPPLVTCILQVTSGPGAEQPVLYDGLAVPNPHSPLAEAVARVGDKWTLLVIDALLDGPRRFGELEQAVAGIAPNTLSQRLRELEAEGLAI